MEAIGHAFDPERHEAMLRVEDSGLPPDTVVEELRSGYVLGPRVLRPAMVKVQA
jgi:molecular chaperone GrpE